MTTLYLRKSISRSPLRRGLLLITLTLAWFALSPAAEAVSPAPDGGYPGGNTAEGDSALFSLTTGGVYNTANGLEALFSDTTGAQNTANGAFALPANTTGDNNTATGFGVLYNNMSGNNNTANGVYALYSNTTGYDNAANGYLALYSNTTGGNNTANGAKALLSNTTGSDNTANGYQALYSNTTGYDNTANGYLALYSNTTGGNNTANGAFALYYNTTGGGNTANGSQALFRNTTGTQNTSNGYQALFENTTGVQNTANGAFALAVNTSGNNNTANGFAALYNNTTGSRNTANGVLALYNDSGGANNTANGFGALFSNTGNYNTAIGDSAGADVTGDGNVCIGEGVRGFNGENNTTRIRNIYATVQPIVGTDPDSVTINSTGRLGRGNVSSRRYKHDIKAMDKASEGVFALKPVTFRYKQEFDPTQTLAFGLIAEEVAKVNPDLVGRNPEGQPESVRYEQINAMLLNEFLKEHRKVQELEAKVTQQRKDFQAAAAHQQEQIEALTAGLQRVSAQVEMSRPAPQMVLNNQ